MHIHDLSRAARVALLLATGILANNGAAYAISPSMLRTIEEVLGLENLVVHDAGLPPMTDAFDTDQAHWTFNAVPSLMLFNTQLPLLNKSMVDVASIPKPAHDPAWWEAQTKGFDFSQEDRVPTELFNRVIWRGLKGDTPYPTFRSGADLRQHRE